MAYRLQARIGERDSRHRLEPGENLVGSGPDCEVRLQHPTVSRRHARILVTDDGLTLEDAGSRNGTRLDGRRVDESVELEPGADLLFGSVQAVVEEVDAADLEPAIEIPTPAPFRARGPGDTQGGSTVGWASLEAFTFRRLPELADRLARGDDHVELAHAVGTALFDALPCHVVEVARSRGNDRALLFTAAHDRDSASGTWVRADAGDGAQLAVRLVSGALAERYAPIVAACAALLRASLRPTAEPRSAAPDRRAPSPPSPPSVVPRMREIYAQAARIAPSDVSVLILGESGTGKELLARYLHAASDRTDRPLVILNCAALPRDLLESELFGVERGVATGVDARPGKFESAHGGTLVLDEIGDMAPETQARILRVLQEREVYRLGGHAPRPADTRVIASTNRDLDAMLSDGRFRSDLYHRIADWVVELPPLRERRGDIPNLAAHFLAKACRARGVRAAGISRAAADSLVAYDWPGNVRQLEKEMSRAALFIADGELLETGHLQPALTASRDPTATGQSLKDVVERAEREHIERTLSACGGAVADAAAQLDVGLSTLYRRMRVLGI